jgi:hypothetical protein
VHIHAILDIGYPFKEEVYHRLNLHHFVENC